MLDINKFDAETKSYFESLPPVIKEQILQSGMNVNSKSELVSLYENITAKKTEG